MGFSHQVPESKLHTHGTGDCRPLPQLQSKSRERRLPIILVTVSSLGFDGLHGAQQLHIKLEASLNQAGSWASC